MTIIAATARQGFGAIAADQRTTFIDGGHTWHKSIGGKVWISPDRPLAMAVTGARRTPLDPMCPIPALPPERDAVQFQAVVEVAGWLWSMGGPMLVMAHLPKRLAGSSATVLAISAGASGVDLIGCVFGEDGRCEFRHSQGGVISESPRIPDFYSSRSVAEKYGADDLGPLEVAEYMRGVVAAGLAEEDRRHPEMAALGKGVEVALVDAEGARFVPASELTTLGGQ